MYLIRMLKHRLWLFVLGLGTYIYILGVFFVHYSSENTGYNKYSHQLGSRIKFSSWEEVRRYREERFDRAQMRPHANGPGERGAPVKLNTSEQDLAERLYPMETLNIVASEKVAMDRILPDNRHPDCATIDYPKDLPNASVIITFHNEPWSTIFRTVHSVVNRTPPRHLHEVILYDDHSTKGVLNEDKMMKYVGKMWPDGIVRYMRSSDKIGVSRASIAAAREAKGGVLIFLEAHCEVNEQWIEPLLTRIQQSRKSVLSPMVDSINHKTMAYPPQGEINIGGFTWELTYTWEPVPESEKARRTSEIDPVRSPTLPRACLAIERSYFWEIGTFDVGMEDAGGETIELSFRVWMCGGTIEFIPCSRIGHIFGQTKTYSMSGQRDSEGLNHKRIADVWLDAYKRHFYMFRKDLINKDKESGDISNRLDLRRKLNCNNFSWYLENVFPQKFILDEKVFAHGMVRNPSSNLCLDTMGADEKHVMEPGLYSCQGGSSRFQNFAFTYDHEIRREVSCLDSLGKKGAKVRMIKCHGNKGNQQWNYDNENGKLTHSSGLCLQKTHKPSGLVPTINKCDGSDSQKWEFENYLYRENLTEL